MAKRASLPEGKSVFFRQEGSAPLKGPTPIPPELLATGEEKRPTRQSAIFLEERHLDWLDDKRREARKNGGLAIRKAAIIRALLDVAMEAPLDLTCLRRQEDLVHRIRQGLRSLP